MTQPKFVYQQEIKTPRPKIAQENPKGSQHNPRKRGRNNQTRGRNNTSKKRTSESSPFSETRHSRSVRPSLVSTASTARTGSFSAALCIAPNAAPPPRPRAHLDSRRTFGCTCTEDEEGLPPATAAAAAAAAAPDPFPSVPPISLLENRPGRKRVFIETSPSEDGLVPNLLDSAAAAAAAAVVAAAAAFGLWKPLDPPRPRTGIGIGAVVLGFRGGGSSPCLPPFGCCRCCCWCC